MSQLVTIIDYGSGNLRSAAKAFERASREVDAMADVQVTSDPDLVRRADRIVLPGVGAFADCRAGLDAVTGMVEVLQERVIRAGVPFLGICVGMQLMADEGREKAVTRGLGWIPGAVVRLEPPGDLKVPHMGWNTLRFHQPHPCSPASRMATRGCTPISSTPTISPRPVRRTWWRRPITASRSPPSLAATTCWARSFTPKRARPLA